MECMNRAERRALARKNQKRRKQAEAASQKASFVIEQKKKLMQSGVSGQVLGVQDLTAMYDEGFAKGYAAAAVPTIQSVYAAFLIAAHDTFGFAQTRGVRLLKRAHAILSTEMSNEALIQKVLTDFDVDIDLSVVAERFQKGGVSHVGLTSDAAASQGHL